MAVMFSSDLRIWSLLVGSLWFVCHGSDCPPCDPGQQLQLCHPPAFPDMLSTFQDTLSHSPVIRNLTEMLLSSLVLTNCRYSLLTTTDWTDFNARRCPTEADELRSSDEACRHDPSPSPLDFTRLRPLQPFSLSAESHGDDEDDEEDYYDEEEGDEEDGMEEIEVDKDTYGDEDDVGDKEEEEVAVGGWMVSSSRPQSNPRKGLAMYPQGIALIIGISCSILSLVCGIVILIYIRRRYYSHPKYETPPEEALCLRWMQSRFGVGDGTTSCQHPCYSTAAEERMRTNAPGHPIKRYL